MFRHIYKVKIEVDVNRLLLFTSLVQRQNRMAHLQSLKQHFGNILVLKPITISIAKGWATPGLLRCQNKFVEHKGCVFLFGIRKKKTLYLFKEEFLGKFCIEYNRKKRGNQVLSFS